MTYSEFLNSIKYGYDAKSKSHVAEMANQIINDYVSILPDHLGSMEVPVAKMCARRAVELIISSNPQFTPYGLEPIQGSVGWWKQVLEELNK